MESCVVEPSPVSIDGSRRARHFLTAGPMDELPFWASLTSHPHVGIPGSAAKRAVRFR